MYPLSANEFCRLSYKSELNILSSYQILCNTGCARKFILMKVDTLSQLGDRIYSLPW